MALLNSTSDKQNDSLVLIKFYRSRLYQTQIQNLVPKHATVPAVLWSCFIGPQFDVIRQLYYVYPDKFLSNIKFNLAVETVLCDKNVPQKDVD